jgi:DME family drug/metabolite transporter
MEHCVAPSNRRALLYVAVAGIGWGTGGAVAALLFRTGGLDYVAVSFWRLAGGAFWLALAWPFLARRTALVHQLMTAPRRLLLTGIGLAIYQVAYIAAVALVGVALSTVIALGAGPLFIALGARERITATLVAALAGLALLVFGGGETAGTSSLLGIGLSVLSAAGYAGTTLLNRGLPDPIGSAMLGFAIGACCLLPFAIYSGVLPTLGSLPLLAYLGLVPSALAYGLFYVGLTAVRASTASVLALTEPLVATVIGVVLLHERLSLLGGLGGVILLTAVVALAVRE